ncbi:DUF2628 domain-containing protein [Pseudomonas sp. 5P_3.1_Bac2]|uniref:DUF2628 domain-containing protein n=1 Tax=Pseudomonas sp. 5P_3.1_Bac2 TaxID=2971617 RepID=UPI0021C75F56|nr:DUF2628 domain-containing protein [Pseudomonas sp. 5P_3.1_Bac2]MCU1717798.1 DUF2628 domain-containing protein [Pseudomonas sp. 5P_3.1_Bac2]
MTDASPYQSPQSSLTDPASTVSLEQIEALAVSARWKKRFRGIHLAGGPKMPHFKQLTFAQRWQIGTFNVLAFLFGPFYYLAKGMWRKALSLFVVCVSIAFAGSLLLDYLGYAQLGRALGYGVAAVFAVRANIDYYKKCLLNDNGWW